MKRQSNVSRRRLARSARRLRRDLPAWRCALRGAGVLLLRWQLGSRRVLCDPGLLTEMLALPPEWSDAPFEQWLTRIHPQDRRAFAAALEAPSPAGGAEERVIRLQHADGRWLSLPARLCWMRRGQPVSEVLLLCRSRRPETTAERSDAEAAFRTIIENSTDIIARFNLDLSCQYINRSLMRYLPGDGPLRRDWPEAWPVSWREPLRHALEQVRRQGLPRQFELILEPDEAGDRYVFETRLFPEFDADGALGSILCIAREITEASQARRLLTEENAVLEMIADNLPIRQVMHSICQMIEAQLVSGMASILTLNDQGDALTLSAAPSLPTDYCGYLATVPIEAETGACGAAAFWKRSVIVNDIATSPLWHHSLQAPALAAGLRACWSTPIFTSDHQLLGTLAIYYAEKHSPNATELRLIYRCSHIAAIALQRNLHEAQLYRLATQDGLTRLYNRRHFIESAERHLSQAKRYQHPVSVLMLDLDRFKLINDRFGHAVGDRVLIRFSQICRACLRTSDIVGRMGGEEFAALLPDTTPDEALQVAERLRQQVDQAELEDEDRVVRFQVSIGIAALARDESLDSLLIRADRLLYRAKAEGRNRVCVETGPATALDSDRAAP